MNHVPHLISDLALILAAAGFVTLLFKKLKQPLVLGYIMAGFLVGPHFNLFPSVTETANISVWGEIGVIFLLFGLGLEFSFKKLLKVGGTAAITAITGVSATIMMGFLLGKALGWNGMDSLFLGGILGIASTAIIIRAFEELGVKTRRFAGVVMGVLVIEDLVAVVLLVLLSTVAVSRQFSGSAMLGAVGKLSFFLVLWFLGGIFFIPTFLRKAKKLLNDETILIIALALCFGMVLLANSAGFSSALGAFIMGSILAETVQGARIEHILKPLKDLFAAIFFVSVGMLIDPKMLMLHIWPILIGSMVLLVGKPLFVMIGAIVSGQTLKTSIRSGMTLSQIGEFSFIIATLGLTLNVTSDFLYPIAVTISVITAFTTPYMIRLSEPAHRVVENMLPQRWKELLSRYSAGARTITTVSDWRKLLRTYGINMLLYSVILLAIVFVSLRYIRPIMEWYGGGNMITALVTLSIMSPFLYALSVRRQERASFVRLWVERRYRGPLIVLEILRIALGIFSVGFLLDQMFSAATAFAVAMGAVVTLIVLRKRVQRFYYHIEARFLTNLNEKEELHRKQTSKELAPWDAHIAQFEVDADGPLTGKTLITLQLRESFGVNVAMIERGTRILITPVRTEHIYPGDILSIIGTDEQLEKFKTYLAQPAAAKNKLYKKQDVVLRQLTLKDKDQFVGKNIRESALREKSRGIIVGIERDGERMLNPDSAVIFLPGDIVWIVGHVRRLELLLKEESEIDSAAQPTDGQAGYSNVQLSEE